MNARLVVARTDHFLEAKFGTREKIANLFSNANKTNIIH
jgi:hypothetical protein